MKDEIIPRYEHPVNLPLAETGQAGRTSGGMSEKEVNAMMERRRAVRKNFTCPLQVQAISGDAGNFMRNSFCRNISLSGLSMTSFDFYPVNGNVHLQIFSDAWIKLIEVIGHVVWVEQLPFQSKYKIGVEFMDRSSEMDRSISRLLDSEDVQGD
ncbi:MAG: PilZ domain-containing protein [Candidatus Omnitrophica bacterium]|nr:PilZ domain-containing protein [Candidatus Omnitrophota bacterium]MBU4479156.1 PilZ domain-containing protein [Candidatus Omnitrophota bacterium]MCG2702795.1 PilZ domain-containing protein [Candidatus Omnitrophota bacterium]